MANLAFRPATAADIRFILALVVADSKRPTGDDPESHDDPRYLAALAAINADPNHELMVAEFDGLPVGTIQLSFLPGIPGNGGWRGQIENVHISPDYRNRGFGTQLIGWAVARCRVRGCTIAQLTSNKLRIDAHRFYKRLGFEASHEGFKLYL